MKNSAVDIAAVVQCIWWGPLCCLLTVFMFSKFDTEQRTMIMSHQNVSKSHQCTKTASKLYHSDISIKHCLYIIILLPKSMFTLCLISSQGPCHLLQSIWYLFWYLVDADIECRYKTLGFSVNMINSLQYSKYIHLASSSSLHIEKLSMF